MLVAKTAERHECVHGLAEGAAYTEGLDGIAQFRFFIWLQIKPL